jgi:uncharacterized protein YaaN involved in tellurite resistance
MVTTPSTPAAPAVTADSFQLAPPEVLSPLSAQTARTAVPLKPELQGAVDAQVERFVEALLAEDVHSDAFKAKLDSAFALGKEEISIASSLMQGRFMQRNFVGVEDSAAFKAIQDMRGHLDELNPGKDGDLLQPQKLLGLIPFGNKLQAYFRKFESAGGQLQAMQKLAGAVRFAEKLDGQLAAKVDSLQATDPQRAQALQQEVLFYARQNLTDMLTQQAVCTNGYLALDVLKKTGREMMNGCSRVATTGMSALAVAQTVARATGNQIKVMEMLQGVNTSIENLITETGRQLNNHVDKTAQFAQNPMIGIDKIREMFDQTFKAMDAMDSFRAKAIDVMGQNNKIMSEQLAKADQYVDRVREQKAREATRQAISGPVAL